MHSHHGPADVITELARAEDAVRRGDYRSAMRSVARGTGTYEPAPLRPRFGVRTLVAAAIMTSLVLGSAAAMTLSATGRHSTGSNAAAIHIADSALTAAGHVNDPAALADLVTSVQDTIADLTPQARSNSTLRAQLDALAQRQEQLLSQKTNVPAALVTRAHALVVAVQSLSPSTLPVAPTASPAPSGLP